jgi:hypothetical protein
MLQFRGLNGPAQDAVAAAEQQRNIAECGSDPVCLAFYGAPAPTAGMTKMTAQQAALLASLTVGQFPTGSASTATGSSGGGWINPGTKIITTSMPSVPWFKTWWGVGLIGLAGFGVYKYSRKKKSAPASV